MTDVSDRRHEFDDLDWCIHCGAGREQVLNRDRSEECSEDVIGISHLVGRRRMNELIGKFRWGWAP